MSEKGNLDYIAAKVAEIDRSMKAANDARLDSFRGLLSSIESSLADLVENVEKGGGSAAIDRMADALSKIRMPEVRYEAPAIDLRPIFNVPPASAPAMPQNVSLSHESALAIAEALSRHQVTVEASMPSGPAPTVIFNAPRVKSWDLKIKGQYGAPDRVMTIQPNYLE